MQNEAKQRDYSLDFIKIIATIFIIFHHYQQVIGVCFDKGINFYNGKFYFGYMVELFFVLSGYFMYSYIEKIQKGVTFRRFFLKRFLRLFPLMMLGAITYEVFLAIYQNMYQSSWFDIQTTLWGTIIASLGIQDGWALPNPCVNNSTWYISVLLLCYIIFYFIVYLSKRLSVSPKYFFVFMIFLGMGINTYGINLPFLNASSSRGYYAFFFGIILADLIRERRIEKKDALLCIFILIIITVLIIFRTEFVSTGINYIMTYIYYPALIIVCKSDFVGKILNRKFIGKLGQISFDVYIWHNPFYILLFILIKVLNWNIDLNSYWTMIGYAVVCYLFGVFSYYCIEQPISKWVDKKNWIRRIIF